MLASCNTATHKDTPVSNVALANKFIDAFYSFNRYSLESLLTLANETKSEILYYQKWAECGHYEVLKRDTYSEKNDSLVIFPVTVKDDLMAALHINFNVTDTFRISIQNGQIRSIRTSSNDPSTFFEARDWVKKNRPDLIEKACVGNTPCECIQAMLKGFEEFTKEK